LVLAVAGCSDDGAVEPSNEGGSGGGGGDSCSSFEADAWQAGDVVFREATDEWGLTGVASVRVNVLDIDADGWPDLLLRRGGGPDDFSAGGGRSRFLMRNSGNGSFEDVTESSGLLAPRLASNSERNAEVMCAADADNDGDVDVFMAKGLGFSPDPTSETSELMLNQGDGTFVLGPATSDARGEGWAAAPRGCSFSDVDLDGKVDLFVTHNTVGDPPPLQDKIYLGDGSGAFADLTLLLGLGTSTWGALAVDELNAADGHSWGWATLACDLNNDRLPELLASSYGRAPNHLWQAYGGPGAVGYVNRSVASGYAYDHREDWTDNISAQCHCQDVPTDDECDTVPAPPDWIDCPTLKAAFGGTYRWYHAGDREPWRLGGNSATTTCADVNNDGWFDLMTGEIVHWDVGASSDPAELMFNSGEPEVRFERPGNEVTGLSRGDQGMTWDDGDMNNAVFDFDNDGWLDVYISSSDYPGTRGWLFHQVEAERFELVPLSDGVDHLRSAGAIAVDVDRDGDLDLVVGHSRFRCGAPFEDDCYEAETVRLFENLTNDRNHWLELRLEGAAGSNRSAVGARVVVEACGLSQSRQVDGGHGHQGAQQDMVLHFGLGRQTAAEVTVYWPDATATTETFSLDADGVYHIVQGGEPELLTF